MRARVQKQTSTSSLPDEQSVIKKETNKTNGMPLKMVMLKQCLFLLWIARAFGLLKDLLQIEHFLSFQK